MFQNVMIGYPIVALSDLIPVNEFKDTLVTSTRYLPKIMVEAGIVKSTSEVIRNRKDLCITFPDDMTDCITIKWGKKFLYIVIGNKYPVNIHEMYLDDQSLIGISFDGINWQFKGNYDPNKDIRLFETKHTLVHVLKDGIETEPVISKYYLLWR